MFKKIYLIVASVSLATIVSCSSVRKTKTSSEVKENTTIKTDTNTKVDESVTNTVTNTGKLDIRKEGLGIEYNPSFDSEGKMVPFVFEKVNKDGTKTTINITGNATVKYFSEDQVEDMVNVLNESYNKKLDSAVSKVDKKNSIITTNTKEKTKSPDYLKYLIGIVITLILFSAIIIIMYLYFKKKIVNITKLIP